MLDETMHLGLRKVNLRKEVAFDINPFGNSLHNPVTVTQQIEIFFNTAGFYTCCEFRQHKAAGFHLSFDTFRSKRFTEIQKDHIHTATGHMGGNSGPIVPAPITAHFLNSFSSDIIFYFLVLLGCARSKNIDLHTDRHEATPTLQ